jgi:hypothetical protein
MTIRALLRGLDTRLDGIENVVVRPVASIATRRVGKKSVRALVAVRSLRVTVHAAEPRLLYMTPVIESERQELARVDDGSLRVRSFRSERAFFRALRARARSPGSRRAGDRRD